MYDNGMLQPSTVLGKNICRNQLLAITEDLVIRLDQEEHIDYLFIDLSRDFCTICIGIEFVGGITSG